MQGAEFRDDRFDAVDEVGELQREGEVAAVPDPVEGLADDRPARGAPGFLRLCDGVPSLAEDVREEVGEEAAFGVAHAGDVGDHAAGRGRSD